MCDSVFEMKLGRHSKSLCDSMKKLVRQFSDLGMWSAALFWADKVRAIGRNESAAEVQAVASCMLQKREYHRAAHTITSRGFHKTHLMCYYVACRALLEANEYTEALQLLEEVIPDDLIHLRDDDPPINRVIAAIYVVKGRVLSAMERRAGAGKSFLDALMKDIFCYEALDYITRHHMLTPQQEAALLESLPFETQCTKAESSLLKLLYHIELNRFGSDEKEPRLSLLSPTLSDSSDETVQNLMEHSTDVTEGRVRYLLRKGEFENCLQELGQPAGDSEKASELRTACLSELKRAPALFLLAHRLVDKYPQSATSWFAVGCYYYIIGKSEFARRYLSKATTLDKGLGAAWLAYGHSFAADNEHDQAMAAYFKASQLMSGCHLPLLYIGLECGLTNNSKMADKFFQEALILAPNDAHVTHEMGVIAFQNQQYEEAERLWREALAEIISSSRGKMLSERWQPLLNNLGHACRKNKKYKEAIAFHEQALTIIPCCGSTYAALGLCFTLTSEVERAIEAFHSALSKKPEDTFATTMLTFLVDQFSEQALFGDGEIPEFEFMRSNSLVTPMKTNTGQGMENRSEYNLTCTSDMSMSFDE